MNRLIVLFATTLAVGCHLAKPACAVIDIADHVCEYVTVQYVDQDGTVRTQKVPVSEIRTVAMRARQGSAP